jgi:hypothetical protein
MSNISVVRNVETISLLTITEEGVVCVDIPLPKYIGERIEIQSEFLNLNVPPAKISKMKPLSEGLNITALDGTPYVIRALQNKRPLMLKGYAELCEIKTLPSKKQDTIAQEGTGSPIRKKKIIKFIRGKKKTN